MAQVIRRGLRSRSSEAESPSRSAVPGRKFLDGDVGPFTKASHQVSTLGVLQVHRHAALTSVDAHEVRRLPTEEGRTKAAGVVAALWVLDLDHFGAEIGEVLGREGARQDPGHVDDQKAGEWRLHSREKYYEVARPVTR